MDEDDKDSFSIQELMIKLRQYPFDIMNDKELKLVARYFVEDNSVDENSVNLELRQNK